MWTFFRSSILLFLVWLIPCAADAKTFVLSVGISDYPGKVNDLRMSHNDAATMDWLYRQNGSAETLLLMNENATVEKIEKAMEQLYRKAGSQDYVVFFFSGHGVPGGFAAYDGFLTYKDVRTQMSHFKSRRKMIFADACYSGAIRQSGSRTTKDYGLEGSRIMLFLSCRTNENSIERKDMTNGLFTHALQHALRGNADADKNRIITAKELFAYVSSQVKKLSKDRQHPVMWGQFSEEMPVISW